MQVRVRVPAALRSLAGHQSTILVDLSNGSTVGDVLAALQASYPGVHDAALDEQGAVRMHVNVFVGEENIRFAAGLATPVPAGIDVSILPAVSGG